MASNIKVLNSDDDPARHAILTWDGEITERELLQPLTRAVNDWVCTTEDGHYAWRNSANFTVEELAKWLHPDQPGDLERILHRYNIDNLRIKIVTGSYTGWDVDACIATG